MNFLIDLFTMILKDEAVEKLAATKIASWYKKYKDFNKKVGKVKHVYNLVMNPNNWIKAMMSLPKQEINEFFHDLADWKKYYKEPNFSENNRYNIVDDVKEVGMDTSRGENKVVAQKLGEMSNELNGEGKWVSLSSSWIKRGMWKMMYKNKLLGTLSIETSTSNTIYVYPMVPYDVWVMMKEANGKNGTRTNPAGAGSVFWKYWLDKWLPSALRRKVQNDFNNKKISRDEYNIALEQAQVSARSFYKSNTAKYSKDELNKSWYEAQGGKGYKTYRTNTYKDLYKTKYRDMYEHKEQRGFTTMVHNYKKVRNPNYITKKEQANIKRQARDTAKQSAEPFKRVINARKSVKKASHPIRTGENAIRSKIRKGIRSKYGK